MAKERTFVILKPDTIQRGRVGDIVDRLERTGLKLVAAKLIRASEAQLLLHYGKDDAWYTAKGTKRKQFLLDAGKKVDKKRAPIEFGRDIIRDILRFMQSTPVLAMVWHGNQAVAVVKKVVGGTDPSASGIGTIRGDYQLDSYDLSDTDQRALRNLVHCSDQVSEAEREIPLWFTPSEIHDYDHVFDSILRDA